MIAAFLEKAKVMLKKPISTQQQILRVEGKTMTGFDKSAKKGWD